MRRFQLCLLLLATSLAQSPGLAAAPPYRIGWLSGGDPVVAAEQVAELRKHLRELGHPDDQLLIEFRSADGDYAHWRSKVNELVQWKPDVIISGATPGTRAAAEVAGSIPIVFRGVSDPVGQGFVKTLARPGGNITGITSYLTDTAGKMLELLLRLAPGARHIAVLGSTSPGMAPLLRELQANADRDGLVLDVVSPASLSEIEEAFKRFARNRADALVVLSDQPTIKNRERVSQLAASTRLPAIYTFPLHVEVGGLMSYGRNSRNEMRDVAKYVHRILKGAKPGDLAVQGPSEFELAINLSAARALGLVFPSDVLLRADIVFGR